MLKFNKIFFAGVSLVLLLPNVSLAATTTTSNFCTNVATIGANMDQRLQTRMTNLSDHQTQVLSDIQTKRLAIDSQLSSNRSKWAKDRQNEFTALNNNATTDAKKQAVAAFATSLTTAIATREKAVDAALAAFRSGEDKAVADHQQAMLATITTFKTSVDNALAKAKSDCSSSISPAIARTTFRSSIQAAIKTLQTDHQAIDKLGPQIQALAKTRNTAVQTALQTFKTTAEQLRTTLKQALSSQ